MDKLSFWKKGSASFSRFPIALLFAGILAIHPMTRGTANLAVQSKTNYAFLLGEAHSQVGCATSLPGCGCVLQGHFL
jgi:hypothetical protein